MSRFVTQSRKQWKSQISAMLGGEAHDCNVLSMFTNSKLFQRLLCIGVSSSELCKLQLGDAAIEADVDDRWLASLNGRNVTNKSTHSSDTEAMEYEDIDRYLVTVDSAAVAKDIMEGRPLKKSGALSRSRHQRRFSYCEQDVPSPAFKDHDPDFTVGHKLSLKIKRKYTKRKKTAKQNGPASENDGGEGDVAKIQRTRVVKIIDPGQHFVNID